MSTWRTTFETQRSHEYFEEDTLRGLIGYDKPLWPLTLIKELVDNALDECEMAKIAPEVAVTVGQDSFTVTDNGGGLSTETIEGSLNYDVRVSNKKAYVGPTRGRLGSALKTLWPACAVATGTKSVVEIIACGWHHTVTAYGGGIKSHAKKEDATVKNGTFIRVHWPEIACFLTHDERDDFYHESYPGRMDTVIFDVMRDFAAGNPHATFSVAAGNRNETFRATNPEWKKWRACDRPSAHWCSVENVRSLLVAYHGEDKRLDKLGISHRRRTLRDCIASFDGLKGTQIRKRVLEQANLSGVYLDQLFTQLDDDEEIATAAELLLDTMRDATRKPKPKSLGIIGKAHMSQMLAAYGADEEIVYRKAVDEDEDGMPYIVEVCFGVRMEDKRKMAFSLNNSIVFQTPTEHISDTLAECRIGPSDPVVLLIAATTPKFAYTSQGKNSLMLTEAMEESLDELLVSATKDFTKYKNSEEARRNQNAITAEQKEKARNKEKVMSEEQKIKAAAFKFMAEAYRQASEPYNTATARQVMYSLRPYVEKATGGKCWKNYGYFAKLLEKYQEEHDEETADWDVTYDARGHMQEPHTSVMFGIGTVETREYISGWMDGREADALDIPQIAETFPTKGPAHRYAAAIFVEKEGFNTLIQRSGIAQAYDAAFFSSKGQSTKATRQLVDSLSQAGVKILVLHDFDRDGMRICHWLSHNSPKYTYETAPDVHDIGLRLPDINRLHLASEGVVYRQTKDPKENLRDCDDITQAEIDFLVRGSNMNPKTKKLQWHGRRVELNAMTSKQFVSLIERNLVENGVKKVIPNRDTLKIAWRRIQKIKVVNAAVAVAAIEINDDDWACPAAPRDLATQVREMLSRKPLMPWDAALAQIAAKRGGER